MNKKFLPTLPKNLARLCTRLANRDIAVPLVCAQSGISFILRLETGELEFFGGNFTQEKAVAQTDFLLEVDGEDWRLQAWGQAAEVLLAPPAGLNPEDIPAELRPALLALALEPFLDRACAALGHTFRLSLPIHALAEHDSSAQERFMLPFTLSDSAGNPAGAGRAQIPFSPAALSVLADLAKLFPRRLAADCSSLLLSLSLCAGREAFPLNLLRQAEPGDIICFSSPAEPTLTLEVNSLALWKARLADRRITIQGILNSNLEEIAMSATPENIEESEHGAKIGGLSQEDLNVLEITLTLELDERRISVGELAALGPGQILETAASLDAPVTLKASGRSIGKGLLVEVGDRLGVQIISLNLRAKERDEDTA